MEGREAPLHNCLFQSRTYRIDVAEIFIVDLRVLLIWTPAIGAHGSCFQARACWFSHCRQVAGKHFVKSKARSNSYCRSTPWPRRMYLPIWTEAWWKFRTSNMHSQQKILPFRVHYFLDKHLAKSDKPACSPPRWFANGSRDSQIFVESLLSF